MRLGHGRLVRRPPARPRVGVRLGELLLGGEHRLHGPQRLGLRNRVLAGHHAVEHAAHLWRQERQVTAELGPIRRVHVVADVAVRSAHPLGEAAEDAFHLLARCLAVEQVDLERPRERLVMWRLLGQRHRVPRRHVFHAEPVEHGLHVGDRLGRGVLLRCKVHHHGQERMAELVQHGAGVGVGGQRDGEAGGVEGAFGGLAEDVGVRGVEGAAVVDGLDLLGAEGDEHPMAGAVVHHSPAAHVG